MATGADAYLRPFESRDAGGCMAIIRACIRADPLILASCREILLRSETEALMRERATLFYIAVWVRESRILALGGLDLNEIRMLFVDPEHQNERIGGALLAHMEGLVPAAVFRNVFVYAAAGAVGFYRKYGYESGGEHAFAVGSHTMLTVFMTKHL
jgi:GNAT superfamily N-acetyltransferase